MNTVGFVISGKENEKRRALLPEHIKKLKNKKQLFFEKNYATHLGIEDKEYEELGCSVQDKDKIYGHKIICNPKAPEPEERLLFGCGQLLFGWIHAVQSRDFTDFLVDHKMTALAWENMFDKGQHCFWRNNEIAGEAAILHAIRYMGKLPFGLKAAIIGRGNCARGAYKVLAQLGVEITSYSRATESMIRKDIDKYDIIVNAVSWDVFRKDHIIYLDDLNRMKFGSIIIDISCDEKMGVESSIPTTINDPVYIVNNITHYSVDHTPAIFYETATKSISETVSRYIDFLVEGIPNDCLDHSVIIEDGVVVDDTINKFQNR